MARYAAELGIVSPGITEEAMKTLASLPWQGNIRELANTIQKALVFNRGIPLSRQDIIEAAGGDEERSSGPGEVSLNEVRRWVRGLIRASKDNNLFDSCVDQFASILIGETLSLTQGNRSQAARVLGLSRPTLYAKIDKYRLTLKTVFEKEDF